MILRLSFTKGGYYPTPQPFHSVGHKFDILSLSLSLSLSPDECLSLSPDECLSLSLSLSLLDDVRSKRRLNIADIPESVLPTPPPIKSRSLVPLRSLLLNSPRREASESTGR